ncbi:GNAT family N-acetyltransferase [Rhodococcus fascians]|nr:GNAT family N-acetyltransferase [Rhodococcus fascians]
MTAVQLRPAVRSDSEFLFSMASNIEVVRWIGDGKQWSAEYFDRRFERALNATGSHEPDAQRWFVGTTERHVRVGLLSTIRRSDHMEIGYWVHPDHWGFGYAGALLVHAREQASGLPLAAQVHQENEASRRVLKRAGFTLVDDGNLLTYRRHPTPGLTTS